MQNPSLSMTQIDIFTLLLRRNYYGYFAFSDAEEGNHETAEPALTLLNCDQVMVMLR